MALPRAAGISSNNRNTYLGLLSGDLVENVSALDVVEQTEVVASSLD